MVFALKWLVGKRRTVRMVQETFGGRAVAGSSVNDVSRRGEIRERTISS